MKNHILETGASGNLGKILVEELHNEGHFILATVNSEHDLAIFKHLPHVKTAVLDVSNPEMVNQFLKENEDSQLEAAVLLVGGFASGDIHKTDLEMLEKMYKLNFVTAFNVVKPLMSYFEKQEFGQFIFVGSRPTLHPEEGKNVFAYSLSKGLIFNMAEIINVQGKKHNIRATMLVPSTIDTPQNRDSMPDANYDLWISPHAIGKAAAFILSETGKTLKEPIFKLYNNS